MKTPIGVRCNPLHLKQDFGALVKWLKDNDFDSVDLMGPDPHQKAAAESAGLNPGSFDCPSMRGLLTPDSARRGAALESVKAELVQASELDLTTLFACLVPVDRSLPRAENFKIWAEVMPGVVELCESLGINIAIEPWPGPPPTYPTLGYTPEVWRAMFELIPSPNLGLCYDPSHMVRMGIDYLRVLDEFSERIHHVHGKDCEINQEKLYLTGRMPPVFSKPTFKCSEGWWRYCIPGSGAVDWRKVAVGLCEAEFNGIISIELEDGIYMNDSEGNKRGLIAARDHLRVATA